MATQNGKAESGPFGFEPWTTMPTGAMKDAFEAMNEFGGGFGELQRAGLKALGESAQAAGKGAQALNKTGLGYAKDNMQRGVEAARALGSVKSVAEFTELQRATGQDSMKAYMSQANEMATLFTNMMRDTAEPLTAQASMAADTLKPSA